MADTAPPLTEAELDELERLDERAPVPLATSRRVYAMARRALTLESELAQLRSGLYSDSLTDAQVAELQRDIELDVGAWDAVGLRQALLRELQRMRCAMPDLIRRSNELPGLSAAHDEAQHELAQLRREKAEREALERRHTEWVLAAPELGRQVLHYWKSENRHTVQLVYYRDEQHARDGHTEGRPRICSYGHGPTYEAALVAALDKLAPARGVAGDHCEAGNECGRIGCPECQQ
jgi:hypothetical protein